MNFYKLLGVAFNATPEEIKKAYRKKVKLFHPDINPNGKEIFKVLNTAYETLINPEKRQEYDRYINKNSLTRILEEKILDFLGFTDKPLKGLDIKTTVIVSLQDGILSREKTISYERKVICPECEGSSITSYSQIVKCDKCDGEGRIQTKIGKIICFKCLGKGFVVKNPCKTCKGFGYIKTKDQVSFKVPIGVETGDKIRIEGKGHCGLNGGKNGDLIIRFKLDTGFFEKSGKDLILNLKLDEDISNYDYIRIKNPLNEILQIKVPPNSTKNSVIKVKGEGYISKTGERGDIYIRLV